MDETNEPIYPGRTLTVVIRDDSAFIFIQEPPTHRVVQIELTDQQVEKLALRWIGSSGPAQYYETVSQCWLEPRTPTQGGPE